MAKCYKCMPNWSCDEENKQCEPKQTNADRIRAMSDEELAEFLDTITGVCWNNGRREEKLYCDECPMECPSGGCAEWLKQSAEDK